MPSAEHGKNLDVYLREGGPASVTDVMAELKIVQALEDLARACGADGMSTVSFSDGDGRGPSCLRLVIQGDDFNQQEFAGVLRNIFLWAAEDNSSK